MKRITMKPLTLGIVCCLHLLTSCYSRIGKLNMVSTRNVDSKTKYVLIQKDVNGKAKKEKELLEAAIDNAVKQFPTGEFMKNVVIEVSNNGKKIRVIGDVWGTVPAAPAVEKNVTKSVKANIEFKTGNKVTFKNMLGKIIEGTIIGLNQNTAIVEHGEGTKTEVKYEKLTKIER